MKKIIISLNDFRQGGIPRCLHSLLTFIDKEKYQVDVICLDTDGPYYEEIGNILKEKGWALLEYSRFVKNICTFSSTLKEKGILQRTAIIICKIIHKGFLKFFKTDLLRLSIKRKTQLLSGKYDIAISYSEGNCSHLVAHIKCSNKLIWIHNDYKYVADAGTGTDFRLFDKICCVSEATRISFTELYPELSQKTVTLYNTINHELIHRLASQPIKGTAFNNELYSIISIGRISYQKQFTLIPSIAAKLKGDGYKYHWYIIGDGPQRTELEREIAVNNVEDTVILLGKQNNPYKFLAKADLFALTSVYESYPTVINEAIVLNIPIISTNLPSIDEMMNKGQGIVSEITDFPQKIEWIIDHDFCNHTKSTKEQFELFNNTIMNKFYLLIENRLN